MTRPMTRLRASRILLPAAALSLLLPALLATQRPANPQGAAPATARAAATDDYTGYWVSEVTEKWRFRMIVPDKGDYIMVPLNPEGRKVANAWDPAKDQASGEACRSYGAAAILQVPGRLHVYWQDDNTLRMDTDSGTRHASFILVDQRRRMKRLRGKDTRWLSGVEAIPGTGVTARVGLCRTRGAD